MVRFNILKLSSSFNFYIFKTKNIINLEESEKKKIIRIVQ